MLKCPECNGTKFLIICNYTALIDENSKIIELFGEHLRYDLLMQCNECGYSGYVEEFSVKEE